MTRPAVSCWVERGLRELRDAPFAQIDLDDLLGEEPPLAAKVGLDCLVEAISSARHRDGAVGGLLTIPLGTSDVLVTECPPLHDVLATVWEYGPGRQVPGLYLVRPLLWGQFEDVEEYRRALDAERILPQGFAAYYRTWRARARAEAAEGDDFDRTIYVRTAEGISVSRRAPHAASLEPDPSRAL